MRIDRAKPKPSDRDDRRRDYGGGGGGGGYGGGRGGYGDRYDSRGPPPPYGDRYDDRRGPTPPPYGDRYDDRRGGGGGYDDRRGGYDDRRGGYDRRGGGGYDRPRYDRPPRDSRHPYVIFIFTFFHPFSICFFLPSSVRRPAEIQFLQNLCKQSNFLPFSFESLHFFILFFWKKKNPFRFLVAFA